MFRIDPDCPVPAKDNSSKLMNLLKRPGKLLIMTESCVSRLLQMQKEISSHIILNRSGQREKHLERSGKTI
jgi:hypothetical protein